MTNSGLVSSARAIMILTCSPLDIVKISWSIRWAQRKRSISAFAVSTSSAVALRVSPSVPSKPESTISSPVLSVFVNWLMNGLTQAIFLRSSTRLVCPKRLPSTSTVAPNFGHA